MGNLSGTWTETIDLSKIPTCILVTELENREGVRTLQTTPEEMHRIQKAGFEPGSRSGIMGTGPAIILEVVD